MLESRSVRDIGRSFIGRQREIALLEAALMEALNGRAQIVMLAGEPGIGKTRTAVELAAHAEKQGAQVFWGRCHEDQGAPPYWPWVQSIRAHVQNDSAARLTDEMGPGAAVIAEIVPEILLKIDDLDAPPALEPEQARFRLFDSITTFLKNAAGNQPLVLVLDDLQWADRSSLQLLQFLVRELAPPQSVRLLLVGCYRDVELSRQPELSETLAQLSRSAGGGFQRVILGGLSREDTTRFIESSAGFKPTGGLAKALFSRTEGNPFFITEVIRLLEESGELTIGHTGAPSGLKIPEGVRDVIGQRLNGLSEQCNQILTTASVIGRVFDVRLLQDLSDGLSEDQLQGALEEATSFHLIEGVTGHTDRRQFSHSLIQQALTECLTANRKAQLHAKVAEALETHYGNDAEAHAVELAHHFAESQSSTGPDQLVHYSLLAGGQALATYANEDAIAHFETGLVARDIPLTGTETAADDEAAALLFGLARARSAAGAGHELEAAFVAISRAFEYYAEAGNVAQAVAAAEFLIGVPAYRIGGLAELMARALSLVPPDSHEAGRLLSRYGGILGAAEGDYDGAQRALGQAITIAEREGDVALEVQTLSYSTLVSGLHLHRQESVDYGLQAIGLTTGDETRFDELLSRFFITTSLLSMGNLEAARQHASVLRDLAVMRSAPRLLASNGFAPILYLSCLEGDWNAGLEHSDQGLKLSPLNVNLLFTRSLLEYETGNSGQGEIYLERSVEALQRAGPDRLATSGKVSMAIAAIARITGVPGRLELAESAANTVLSDRSVSPIYAINARAALALLSVHKGDLSVAEEQFACLQGHRGTMIWSVSSVDRLLGLLAQTVGNLDQAVVHFEEALTFCLGAGYRPELAWAYCDYADTLLVRKKKGDRSNAKALLHESLAISSELGMQPLMERVIGRLDQFQPSTPSVYPAGLSEREVEVLHLLAAGKSNAVMAAELVLSIRTVERHIANIYSKTHSHSRAEATAFAFTSGLISSQ
ncbi:MAG: AAA family ATPase [Chloroflexi bacterium]|nr:AAA family ATPase [Chloroflexota bacterium]